MWKYSPKLGKSRGNIWKTLIKRVTWGSLYWVFRETCFMVYMK